MTFPRAGEPNSDELDRETARQQEDRHRELETVRFQEPDVTVDQTNTRPPVADVRCQFVGGWLESVDVAYVDGSRKRWGFDCVARASVRQWAPPGEEAA